MRQISQDELFYELRKCHHHAVQGGLIQEMLMANHLSNHCIILKRDEPPALDEIRKEFEEWATTKGLALNYPDGYSYMNMETRLAWEAYVAATLRVYNLPSQLPIKMEVKDEKTI